MGVLANWNGTSILDGVVRLQQRRASLGLIAGWSVAELRLDDDDRERLWAWYRGVQRVTLDGHLELSGTLPGMTFNLEPEEVLRENLCSKEQAIGLLLLVALAEQVRFHGEIGQVWPAIRRLPLLPASESRIFLGSGYPTLAMRAAIEKAARFFRLRHVFDDEEPRKAWATTLSLQFIFPVRDTAARIAEWLVGHPGPVALQKLLGEENTSLSAAWTALGQFRRHRDIGQARDKLRACCWFDGHDIASLLEGALRTVTPPAASAHSGEPPEELGRLEQDPDDRILSAPTLHWKPSSGLPPRLEAAILPQPATADGPKRVELLVDGVPRCRLFLRPNQEARSAWELQPAPQAPPLSLPWADELLVTLSDPQIPLDPLASQAIKLRRSAVELFELDSGHRLDAMPLAEAPLALWLAEGCKLSSSSTLSVASGIDAGSGTLWELFPPWPQDLLVHQDGVLLWSWSRQARASRPLPRPASRRAPGLYLSPSAGETRVNPTDTLEQRLVSSAPVRIVLPEGWEEARLVAGYRGLGRVKLRPAPLRGLLGLGETLLVMKRRPAPDGPPSLLPLAGHVVDHGQVAECESLGEARFRLRLTSNLAIEEDTHVLAWPAQGAPSLLPFTVRTDERGKGLDVEVVSPPRALGLINRGYWLGAWWFDGWEQQLESCGIDAQQALLLLRWLRLPLLQHPDPVRAFALAHMTDTMLAWGGLPQYQPGDLHLASGAVLPLSLSTNEYWAAARKELLEDMPPLTPSLARDIRKEIYWNRLHQPQARALAPLFDALFRFSASFPALLEQALRDDLQHSWSIQFRKCALKVPNNCSFKPKDQRTYRTTRLSEFCSETGMHRARVEPLLQVSPEGLTTQQRMLLHLEGFARLLADTLCS